MKDEVYIIYLYIFCMSYDASGSATLAKGPRALHRNSLHV
ncbi:hypothetical protein AXYL_01004 [Achromobacter xylosoxidans A8]|uniref:Uncharacterized protein n=1 Tax=Achromobacter xylosoxidans (strain A8) TaxID=762376 RepID=E3HJM7_ACHXA|nr:hypothetical protein AXYL_01004 [Achromobacter xylosoxidans A8]